MLEYFSKESFTLEFLSGREWVETSLQSSKCFALLLICCALCASLAWLPGKLSEQNDFQILAWIGRYLTIFCTNFDVVVELKNIVRPAFWLGVEKWGRGRPVPWHCSFFLVTQSTKKAQFCSEIFYFWQERSIILIFK